MFDGQYGNLTSFVLQKVANFNETARNPTETVICAGDFYRNKVAKSETQRLSNASNGFISSSYAPELSLSPSRTTPGIGVFYCQLAALTFLLPLIVLSDAHHAAKSVAFIFRGLCVALSLAPKVPTWFTADHEPASITVWFALASLLLLSVIFLAMMIAMLCGVVIDLNDVAYWYLVLTGQAADAEVVRARVDERRQKEAADRAASRAAKEAKEAAKPAEKAATTSDAANSSEKTPNSNPVPDILPKDERNSDQSHERGDRVRVTPTVRGRGG